MRGDDVSGSLERAAWWAFELERMSAAIVALDSTDLRRRLDGVSR